MLEARSGRIPAGTRAGAPARRLVTLGATYLGAGRCRFLVWAPHSERVAVHIVSPEDRVVPLKPLPRGYHGGVVDGVGPGSLYFYRLDGHRERPDPASRYQPLGVHGPSQVVDARGFARSDAGWCGPAQEELVVYEIHVGTFTPEGTFDAVVPRLPDLVELGVTAVELMPVAQFPGCRNWGYDGVYPFAVQNSYGGPEGLRRLVEACHARGLAVILDVVYNHLGPEGNYLAEFGPYFTDDYRTPWGSALNFDGPYADEVRRFFIENALYWVTEFHVDGLRLDAVHAIIDRSARPFLRELVETVRRAAERAGRRVYLVAESDLNDPRVIRPPELGGYGFDAQWNDDFHHALHALLTGERAGYYRDYGRLEHLARAWRGGYVYTGQYSHYRRRRHGDALGGCPAHRFVVFAQNHDQVGNRAFGERLSVLVSLEGLKVAAAAVLLSPFVPLLFMGEEYGETAPFLYFTDHSDPRLAAAVREGRREEFEEFAWAGEVPDPQDEASALRSRLRWELRERGHHRVLLELYRELLALRRELPALVQPDWEHAAVVPYEDAGVMFVHQRKGDEEVCLIFSFGDAVAEVSLPVPVGRWCKRLDTAETRWLGKGSPVPPVMQSRGTVSLSLVPKACVVFVKTGEE